MVNNVKVRNKKDKEYVWICDYCGKEFLTKKKCDHHQLKCDQNPKKRELTIKIKLPKKKEMFSLFFGIVVLYFLVYVLVSSHAQSNGLPIKNLLTPNKWFGKISFGIVAPTPTPTLTPTPTQIPTSTPAPKKTSTTKANVSGNTNNGGVECVGPDGKHFNTSMDECKKLNESWGKPVNYIVNCTYPPECGGGTKRESKIECDKPCTSTKVNTSNTNTNSANTSNYVMVSLYGGDMIVWCKPEVVQTLNDLYPQVQQSSKLWADTCVVASPPAQCDSLKQDANRKEDSYKSIFMSNCVNKK